MARTAIYFCSQEHLLLKLGVNTAPKTPTRAKTDGGAATVSSVVRRHQAQSSVWLSPLLTPTSTHSTSAASATMAHFCSFMRQAITMPLPVHCSDTRVCACG